MTTSHLDWRDPVGFMTASHIDWKDTAGFMTTSHIDWRVVSKMSLVRSNVLDNNGTGVFTRETFPACYVQHY